MKQAPLTLRRWGRVEYERLADLGAFDDGDPVELIGGQLIVAEPKGSEHATGVGMAGGTARAAPPAGGDRRRHKSAGPHPPAAPRAGSAGRCRAPARPP